MMLAGPGLLLQLPYNVSFVAHNNVENVRLPVFWHCLCSATAYYTCSCRPLHLVPSFAEHKLIELYREYAHC